MTEHRSNLYIPNMSLEHSYHWSIFWMSSQPGFFNLISWGGVILFPYCDFSCFFTDLVSMHSIIKSSPREKYDTSHFQTLGKLAFIPLLTKYMYPI